VLDALHCLGDGLGVLLLLLDASQQSRGFLVVGIELKCRTYLQLGLIVHLQLGEALGAREEFGDPLLRPLIGRRGRERRRGRRDGAAFECMRGVGRHWFRVGALAGCKLLVKAILGDSRSGLLACRLVAPPQVEDTFEILTFHWQAGLQVEDLLAEGPRIRKALFRVLGKRVQHDRAQGVGNASLGIGDGEVAGRLEQVTRDELGPVASRDGVLPGEELVEDQAKGVEVTPLVYVDPFSRLEVLGRGVLDLAEEEAGGGEVALTTRGLGNAEVDELDRGIAELVLGDHHVVR